MNAKASFQCSSDVKVFSEALERVYAEVDLANFAGRIFEVLQDLIPDVVITMDEFNTRTGVARDAISRKPKDYAGWRQTLHEIVPVEHPIYHAIQKGAHHPMMIKEFLSDRQLRSMGLYSELLAPLETKYQIALPLLLPHHVAGITINRDVDFSEPEITVARLLGPHIALAHLHAQRLTALREMQKQPAPSADQIHHDLGLTPREAEVLHWIVQGKRDAEISQIIGSGVRTVSSHVRNILAKLGAETRTAAASEAVRLIHLKNLPSA